MSRVASRLMEVESVRRHSVAFEGALQRRYARWVTCATNQDKMSLCPANPWCGTTQVCDLPSRRPGGPSTPRAHSEKKWAGNVWSQSRLREEGGEVQLGPSHVRSARDWCSQNSLGDAAFVSLTWSII